MSDENTELIPQFQPNQKRKLTKAEIQFNERIQKIKELKECIQKAEEITDELDQLHQTELAPLFQKITAQKIQFIQILDKNYPDKLFRKYDKQKIAYLILDEIDQISELSPDLEAIRQKYLDLGYRLSTPTPRYAEENLLESDEDTQNEPLSEDYFDFSDKKTAHNRAKKNSKPSQTQEKKLEAEKQLQKTIRTLYTELIKELHPDRESDEEIRLTKTEIMKNVTAAYQNKDYFELMHLQIAYLQGLGGRDMQETPKELLQQYNKILLNQKKALETEWSRLSSPLSARGTLIKESVKNKSYLYYKINVDKSQMKKHAQQLKHNNQLFEQDKRYIVQYLENIDSDDFED